MPVDLTLATRPKRRTKKRDRMVTVVAKGPRTWCHAAPSGRPDGAWKVGMGKRAIVTGMAWEPSCRPVYWKVRLP